MYEEHFGLDKRPFSEKATGTEVFVGPQTAKTMAGFRKALAAQDAVVTVSGAVGTGKTTLVERALDAIGTKYKTVRVGRVRMDSNDVLEALLVVLGVTERPNGTIQRFAALRRKLKQLQDAETRVFILVEDAMRAGPETLAELEALTERDAGESDGASIVLMGDEGLFDFMRDPQLARLQQRIRQRHKILPLFGAEVLGYLRHSFRLAGGDYEQIFDTRSAELILQLSDGLPRVINHLVDAVLVSAATNGTKKITATFIADVASDEFGLSADGFDFSVPEPVDEAVPETVAETVPGPVVDDTPAPAIDTTPGSVVEAMPEPAGEPMQNPGPVEGPTTDSTATEEALSPADDSTDIPHLINDTLPDLSILSKRYATLLEEEAAEASRGDTDSDEGPDEEPVSELRPDAKPVGEQLPELRPGRETDAAVIPECEADSQPADEIIPELRADAEPVAQRIPEPEAQPESPAGVIPELEVDPQAAGQIIPGLTTEPQAEVIPELEVDPQAAGQIIPGLTTEPQAEVIPELEVDPQAAGQIIPGLTTEPQAEVIPELEVDSQAAGQIIPELRADAEPVAERIPEPEAQPETAAEVNPELEVDSQTAGQLIPDLEAAPETKSEVLPDLEPYSQAVDATIPESVPVAEPKPAELIPELEPEQDRSSLSIPELTTEPDAGLEESASLLAEFAAEFEPNPVAEAHASAETVPERGPETAEEPAPGAEPLAESSSEPALELVQEERTSDPTTDTSEEAGVAEIQEWERDPTLAELEPDLEALEQAMAFAHGDTAQATVEAPAEPKPRVDTVGDNEELPEITLDKSIETGVQDHLVEEPADIQMPRPAKKADAELGQIAANIASARSLDDIDDIMAETLFGTGISMIAEQIRLNPPSDDSANDGLELVVDEPVADLETVAEVPAAESEPVVKAAKPVEPRAPAYGVREEISIETKPNAANSGMNLSATQRLKTVRALNSNRQSAPRDRRSKQRQSTPAAGKAPEPIEDQINTSITQTLKALEIPPDMMDDEPEEQQKRGFFSRFRRS